MATVYDIAANELIEETAAKMREDEVLLVPEWARFVKTGSDRQRKPEDPDWWFMRSASILRRIYMEGPVGVERLRTFYGGSKNMGRRPHKFKKASGKIIRTILKQLDDAGFTQKNKAGRSMTPKGQSYLDGISSNIAQSA